jgi:N-ethylmaleimide reductase
MSQPTSLLFQPTTLGPLTLKNRLVMAPMTRNRSIGNVPGELVATYYAQRAGAGLIVTEGTAPTADGLGYARIPGVFSDAQVAGWRKRHRRGARRRWRDLRAAHAHRARLAPGQPAGRRPGARAVGDASLASDIWVDPDGNRPASEPIAMTEADIDHALTSYADASALAIEAGFDGVELHAANGYLIDQFLNTASNQRTDAWGGSIANRIRFAVEAARRSAARIGGDRVGIRVSPYGVFNGMTTDPEHEALYGALASELSGLGLAYVHVVDHSAMGAPPVTDAVKATLRANFAGTVILSGGYDRARAEADLAAGKGELVAFGRPFLANPDLVDKLATNAALTAPDFATFYTPGERGYTDYPTGAVGA